MLKLNKEFKLPKEVFGQKLNLQVLAQAIRVYEDNAHPGLRKAKTRSEVLRTGKKLYKQKGTGGARHGSRRANLFVGGGVSHGPRPIRRILNLSKALKNLAKIQAYSAKAKEKEVVVASGFSKIVKTKEAGDLLKELKTKRATFVISDKNKNAFKFLRNLEKAKNVSYKNANAFDIFKGGLIILDEDIFEAPKPVKKVAKKTK